MCNPWLVFLALLSPAGVSLAEGPQSVVDPQTLHGKVLCGYQGWFNAPGDGTDRGWYHWQGDDGFKPGSLTIDIWPDVSELDEDERYDTAFQHTDGRVAQVFSSHNRKTVLRHFRWMRDYGIDGVFMQRFGVEVLNASGRHHFDTVLRHAREGANAHGRVFAVMYDLSGMTAAQFDDLMDDWRRLCDEMDLLNDPRYLRHDGRPVVAVWGVGFRSRRDYGVADCERLIRFLKDDPTYGGCTVMLGVPAFWRTQGSGVVSDARLHEVIVLADIVSPWTVGRVRSDEDVEDYVRDTVAEDLAWCRQRGLELMPVVYPGFSWTNMHPDTPLGRIPRRGGRLLWKQYVELTRLGVSTIYQAMFDEVDEATAIFKVTNDPPVGRFLDNDGLPSDFYLRLVGEATHMLRGQRPVTDELPTFAP